MTATYSSDHTALLIVDPYNDFMSEGGKLYEAIKPTADASGLFGNLRAVPSPRLDELECEFLLSRTIGHMKATLMAGSI